MNRKQLTTLISRNQREVMTLAANNDRGQNDHRINLLNTKRIEAVRALTNMKRGS